MRRSLRDAMKNAFEETTIKNVSIDQFWSPKLKSTWKTKQDKPFWNF